MSRSPFDRLRDLASHYEAETPDAMAEQIAGRATARAPVSGNVLERLRAFASRYERATSFGRAGRIAARAVAVAQSGRPHVFWRRVAITATVGATLSMAGFALGIVANRAAPGDLLYGVDRAYEAVGQTFGSQQPRAEERLVEALNLIDQGREADAVPLIKEAVDDLSSQTGLPGVKDAYRETLEGLTAMVPASEPSGPTETTPVTSPPAEQSPATTVPPANPVVAAPATDAATTLKLAVEALLRHVRAIDADPAETPTLAADLTDTAVEVAAAAVTVEEIAAAETVAAAPTTSEGTTTPQQTTEPTSTTAPSATTITLPDSTPTTVAGDTTASSTTTTVPEDTSTTDGTTSTSTTTTTTVPGDGSGDDGGDGGNPGPIILPPQP